MTGKTAPSLPSFEPGAPPPPGFIPLCVPEIRGNEWAYIKECLDTNYVSSVGSFVNRFEEALAARVGAGYGIATSSGTAALHIALLAAGIGPGDEVIVSSLTFIAPVNAVRYTGAWPVLVDAEPDHWQMDPAQVRAFLEMGCERRGDLLVNRRTGRTVRAIIPVHILGHPVDMDPILELAAEHGLIVIEDATESLGAGYKGRSTGTLGAMGCFSFNGNKLITTGGGGMVVTDDSRLAQRARYLSTQAKDNPVEFVHNEVGYNYRLTNIQAAMGCAQLELLDEYIRLKREIARRYTAAFQHAPGLQPMRLAPWATPVHWLYTLLVDEAVCGISSRDLLAALQAAGIQTRPLWQPAHLSPSQAGAHALPCPVAERLQRTALSLPSSVGLSAADQERVIDCVLEQVGHPRRGSSAGRS